MSNIRLDRILIVDFEKTCWENAIPEGSRSEIIEIGIAEILLENQAQIGRCQSWLVKPQTSEISSYCTNLTGITPRMIARQARSLEQVCNSVRKEFGGSAKVWSAWGKDNEDINQDCEFYNIKSPFSNNFINLGLLYTLLTGSHKNIGLKTALSQNSLQFDGKVHRAGDDAINTAKIFIKLTNDIRTSLKIKNNENEKFNSKSNLESESEPEPEFKIK